MGKFKCCFVVVIMLIIALVPVCASADYPTSVKIGLFYGSSAKEKVELYNPDGFTYPATEQTSITVKAENGGISVYAAGELIFSTHEQLEVWTKAETFAIDGKEYSGTTLFQISDGKLNVINRVELEQYVASVLGKEMSPSWPIEALKAQAVCARTYAMKSIGKHSKYGFDLCSTTDCQSYYGLSAVEETCVQAANETKGQIITYNGSPIDAVYSATDGGYTESAVYVWGGDVPYLSAVEDPYESPEVYAYRWTKELTVQEATDILNNKGYELGTVTNIQIIESTPRGVVTSLRVTGTNGEKEFTKERCRTIFNCLSQAYTLTAPGGQTIELYGGESKEASELSLLTADGIASAPTASIFLKGEKLTELKLNASGAYVFSGRGNGHLVGLSQNGAKGMAEEGFTYKDILTHYYTGVLIENTSIRDEALETE